METVIKTVWYIDSTHSEIGFKAKYMKISTVTGRFDNMNAFVKTENDSFINADFNFMAQIESINTKNKNRDTHLKSDDFFNAKEYPEMIFKSKSFNGNKMIGDLTIKNITKEISLDVNFNGIAVDLYSQIKAGFKITGNLSRRDFNLNWNKVTEENNVVVSDNIKLIIDLLFVKE